MSTYNYIFKSILSIFIFTLFISTATSQNIHNSNIKKNVSAIDKPLTRLAQLEPKEYEYNRASFKDLKLPGGKQYGFIAEDVQQIFPDLVQDQNYSYTIGKNAFRTARIKSVDNESLVPVLVASIKELHTEIEKLKTEIESLKNKVRP